MRRNTFWDALLDGQHGFGAVTLCDISKSPSKIAAEVKDFDLEAYVVKGGVMARHTPRAVRLGLAASVLALHDTEIDLDACDRTGSACSSARRSVTSAKSFRRVRDLLLLQYPRAYSNGHIGLQLRTRCGSVRVVDLRKSVCHFADRL